jgi:TrmH family RNA methyltransferase
MKIIEPYKKESPYSYAAGAYAVIEMLNARPDAAEFVAVHPDYGDADGLEELCRAKGVPVRRDAKLFKRVNQKENTYVLGLFAKYRRELSPERPHVVLVNPSDMGNLGTVIRTLVGLNITDVAVITPAADFWHPKTVRASMGAVFRAEIETFADFGEYRKRFERHELFPFMTDGDLPLDNDNCAKARPYSLIFGNEATGLPEEYRAYGTSVRLPQTGNVDSLNLAVAVGIGAFIFAVANGQV